jgi:protein-tyrosine phosphatase
MYCHEGLARPSGGKRGVMRSRVSSGSVYDAMRNLADRMLHATRHRAVRSQLSRMPRPRNILVVCYGNVCRSPYLEAVLSRALPDIIVSSAGFVGPGRPVPEFALALSAQRGFDLSSFRSRPLQPAKTRGADLVVVMDARQARHMARYVGVPPERIIVAGDLDPMPSPSRAIEDPWQQPLDVFVASFNRLDRCGATLTRMLRRSA